MTNTSKARLRGWVVTTAIAAATTTAHPAAFQLAEQNASGLGAVYAGQAALADDASGIYFNPATLTRVDAQHQWLVGAHLVKPRSTFNDGASCAPFAGTGFGSSSCPFGANGNLGHTPGGNGGSASTAGKVPNLYGMWSPADRLRLGIGVNAPFGLENKRDPAWIGRFHSVSASVTAININPTLAWLVNPQLSLGFGVNAQHLEAKLSNAFSYRAAALGSNNPALIAAVPPGSEGVVGVTGSDWTWGWNAGIDVGVGDRLRLGAAYRSPTRYRLRGDVRFDNRPGALGSVPAVADGAISAEVKLPETWSLALAWRLADNVTLLADWTRTGWDSLQNLVIQREDGASAGQPLATTAFRFGNSARVGVGVAWKVSPDWVLRAGVASESSPVSDANRTARLPDADRRWFGIGLGTRLSDKWSLDAGLALVDSKAAPIAAANQDGTNPVPRGSLVGSFDAKAWIIGVQAVWSR